MQTEKIRLVRLSDTEFVHINEIKRAVREGNYIELWLWNGKVYDLWDEHQEIIEQIRELVGTSRRGGRVADDKGAG